MSQNGYGDDDDDDDDDYDDVDDDDDDAYDADDDDDGDDDGGGDGDGDSDSDGDGDDDDDDDEDDDVRDEMTVCFQPSFITSCLCLSLPVLHHAKVQTWKKLTARWNRRCHRFLEGSLN